MQDSLGKVFAIFLSIILMFLIPLEYHIRRIRWSQEMFIIAKTTEFVDSVRNTGKITKDMLNLYERDLIMADERYIYDFEQVVYGVAKDEIMRIEYDKKDIVEGIEKYDTYGFRINDYFKVTVIKKSKIGDEIICVYGGRVRNEIY